MKTFQSVHHQKPNKDIIKLYKIKINKNDTNKNAQRDTALLMYPHAIHYFSVKAKFFKIALHGNTCFIFIFSSSEYFSPPETHPFMQ